MKCGCGSMIEGPLRIIDWKTGTRLDDAGEQLDFYILGWALEQGELPGRAEAVSVATGERLVVEPTEERAETTAAAVAALVSAARSAFATGGELERRGGPHCRYCPLLTGCPEGSAAVAVTSAG